MKKLLVPLAVLALCTAPAGALDFNEARFASLATSAMMAQLVQVPETGGGIAAGGDTDFTGDNVFQGLSTFGTAADALDAIWFVPDGTICFEGATADAFELCITVTDPDVDSTFTIGYSPDGNPWLGAGAGDAAGASEIDNLCLGENACGAISGTATDNTCLGDNACALVTTADFVVAVGSGALDNMTTGGGGYSVAAGTDALGASTAAGNIGVGYQAGLTVTSGSTNTFLGHQADVTVANLNDTVAVGASTKVHGAGGVAVGKFAEASAGGVSVGSNAGDAQGTADIDNTFGGQNSGTAASGTSTDNAAWGDESLAVLTSGDRVAAFGANTDVGTNTDSDVTVVGESMVGKNSDSMLFGFGGQEAIFVQGSGKSLTDNVATAVLDVSVAQSSFTGLTLMWTVVVSGDGPEYQALSGVTTLQAVNKAGTEVCTIGEALNMAEAASAGTLTGDSSCVVGLTDEVRWALDADSSLTNPVLTLYYTVHVTGPATTLTPQ